MKTKFSLIVPLFFLFFAAACSTKTAYTPLSATVVDPKSVFTVGAISDQTGFAFPQDATEKLVIAEEMEKALKIALLAKGALDEGQGAALGEQSWVINVDVVKYSPGNAFSRWLLPGLGATNLSVVATIADKDGVAAASIPVERYIGAGGAYTIGAWKYVFTEVAEAVVGTLVDPAKREKPAKP